MSSTAAKSLKPSISHSNRKVGEESEVEVEATVPIGVS
jgi:hypothetical protein